MKLSSIGYVMRDNHSDVVMAESKSIGNCFILMAQCAVREAILKTSQKRIQRIIIQSDLS